MVLLLILMMSITNVMHNLQGLGKISAAATVPPVLVWQKEGLS